MHFGSSSKFAIILSIIAIVLSIVAIVTTRPYNWAADTVGVAFAAICALITFLAAWNIYSTINADKKLEIFKNEIESLKNERKEDHNSLKRDIHSSMGEAFSGLSRAVYICASKNQDNSELVFWHILCELTCIVHYSITENFNNCENRINNIKNTLKSNLYIKKGEKEKVYRIISMIAHADKIPNYNDLLSSIENILEQ